MAPFSRSGIARTIPEEPVNPASKSESCDPSPEGLSQPAWPNLSPVTWDYLEAVNRFLSSTVNRFRAFNELIKRCEKMAGKTMKSYPQLVNREMDYIWNLKSRKAQ
jgi:hypothetical protein